MNFKSINEIEKILNRSFYRMSAKDDEDEDYYTEEEDSSDGEESAEECKIDVPMETEKKK